MSHHLTIRRILAPLSLLCALALLLSLSACSSQSKEAEPSASASSDGSFAITATEGIENPDVPERPIEMNNDDEEGAIAAAEYFLRLSLYGMSTDDWNDYNALSSQHCSFCNSYRNNNHKEWKKISSRTMPKMKILGAVAGGAEGAPELWRVDVLVKRYPRTTTFKDGTVQRFESSTVALAFLIDPSNGWHINEVETFDVEKYEELYGKQDK